MTDLPTASYVYDDPRYGWISIQAFDRESIDIVIQTADGSFGYTFKDGEFTPYCTCNAYNEDECACQTGWRK